ncbi:hypothetical protein J6590_079772 [Homalodisca vitripennis]|nr:hypothetical protein J6590_079772 [Homalodisca vitripennis]
MSAAFLYQKWLGRTVPTFTSCLQQIGAATARAFPILTPDSIFTSDRIKSEEATTAPAPARGSGVGRSTVFWVIMRQCPRFHMYTTAASSQPGLTRAPRVTADFHGRERKAKEQRTQENEANRDYETDWRAVKGKGTVMEEPILFLRRTELSDVESYTYRNWNCCIRVLTRVLPTPTRRDLLTLGGFDI